MILATHAALPRLAEMWCKDPEGGKKYQPLAGRTLIIDEAPVVVDSTTLTWGRLLAPLTHLHDFADPEATNLVCDVLRRLEEQVRRWRRRSHAGAPYPSRVRGAELADMARKAVGSLTTHDRWLAAKDEVARLEALLDGELDMRGQTEHETAKTRRALRRELDWERSGAAELEWAVWIEDEKQERNDRELTPFAALHTLARDIKADPREFDPEDLRYAVIDPNDLPDPLLAQAWGALLALVTPAKNDAVDRLLTCGFPEIVANDNKVWLELNRLQPLPTLSRVGGIVILSATGPLEVDAVTAVNPEAEVQQFGLQVHRPKRPWHTTRILLKTRSTSRRRLAPRGKLSRRGLGTVKNVLNMAGALAKEHLPKDQRISMGILTYKPVADHLSRDRSLDVMIPRGIDVTQVGHYGRDDRATNRFEGLDVLLLLGTPWANLGAAQAQAHALGFGLGDEDPSLDVDRVAQHGDNIMHANLLQAVGRLRDLRANKSLLVIVAGNQMPRDGKEWLIRHLPDGRPASPLRPKVRGWVTESLAGGRIASAWILTALCDHGTKRSKPPLSSLLGGFDRLDLGKLRSISPGTLRRWIQEAAEEAGAVSHRVALLPRAPTVWRLPSTRPGDADALATQFVELRDR